MTDIVRHVPVPAPYDRNSMTFSSMVAEAVEVQGNLLIKDDVADELVGVPFLITKVTFRPGMLDPSTKGRRLSYVSCECVIADQGYLSQRKISLDDKPFLPGEHIVINDGSTGIYRQVLCVLESLGYVTLPDGPVTGPKGESRYDLPVGEWTDCAEGEMMKMPESDDWTYTVDVRILAPRGLRLSDYSNEFTQDGRTRYLA